MLGLGAHAMFTPAVVYALEQGGVVSGDAAMRRAATDPDRSARELKRRLGEPTPVVLGGVAYPVAELLGAQLRDVLPRVTAQRRAAPGRVVLAHPANWGRLR